MKFVVILALALVPFFAVSQDLDPSKLPLLPYTPRVVVNGVTQHKVLSNEELLKHGLQIVLEDKNYKVVQFEVIYDACSKSLWDIVSKLYLGDRVLADDHTLKRAGVGVLISIDNTVIESGGQKYRMKSIHFSVGK